MNAEPAGPLALVVACPVPDGCLQALVAPNKRVPSGHLWGGNPARKMRDLREEETQFLAWDTAHYARLTAKYRARRKP